MHLESIHKNRPYLLEISRDEIGGGEEIISHLLKNTEIQSYDSIDFLCSNYEYDAYKIIKNGLTYCIKYSFDSENTSLKNEIEILKLLHPISPRPFKHEKIKFGEMIHYSICSFEIAENIKYSGYANLFANWPRFFQRFSKIQSAECSTSFFDYLNLFFASNSFNSFPEDSIAAIKEYYDFSIFENILDSLKKEIMILCDPILIKNGELCHGKLQPSNILYRNGDFKMIDFTDSYMGNAYLDLSRLSIYLALDSNQEKQMLAEFLKFKNKSLNEQEWQQYRSCYDISIRMIFIELLVNYLKEVYIFSSFRPEKILNAVDIFSKNNKVFFRINPINQHKDFVYKVILEPLIGKEQINETVKLQN